MSEDTMILFFFVGNILNIFLENIIYRPRQWELSCKTLFDTFTVEVYLEMQSQLHSWY